MKSFICAILIFALIIAGATWYLNILDRSVSHIEDRISELEKSLSDENWEDCKKQNEKLMNDWSQAQKWLKAIINHREIDQIQETLYELKGYIEQKNQEEALVKAEVLRMFFRRIPENEDLSFINIL